MNMPELKYEKFRTCWAKIPDQSVYISLITHFCHSECLFYINKVKNKLISIFTSFLRIPIHVLKCQPGICTVHCQSSSAFCHRGHFLQKVCGAGGGEKEKNVFSDSLVAAIQLIQSGTVQSSHAH